MAHARKIGKFMKLNQLLLITLLSLHLMACNNSPTPEPTATHAVPTEVLEVAEFVTPEPTATLNVTNTPTIPPTPAPTASATITPSPTISPTIDPMAFADERPNNVNPLTGLKVDDPNLLRRRPLMVRVGNDFSARPQVSLDKADVVYEEITEWWVTRFSAIFLSHDPETIAPIRSVRLSNIQLAPQYQAALAHSGGSDPVRWELSQVLDIANLDEFFHPKPFFYRENEGWQTRLAFDATAARDYLQNEGLTKRVTLRGFHFQNKLTLKLEAAEVITVPYPPRNSPNRWVYDDNSGGYLRWTGDSRFMSSAGQQITTNNLIIYFAEHQETNIIEDSNGATSIRMMLNGRGTAWVLRDGKIIKGNWETNGLETPLFTFDNGEPIPLKSGNTWIQVVPLGYEIEIDGRLHNIDGMVELPTSNNPS